MRYYRVTKAPESIVSLWREIQGDGYDSHDMAFEDGTLQIASDVEILPVDENGRGEVEISVFQAPWDNPEKDEEGDDEKYSVPIFVFKMNNEAFDGMVGLSLADATMNGYAMGDSSDRVPKRVVGDWIKQG